MKALENNEVMVPPTSNERRIAMEYMGQYALPYIEDIQLIKEVGMTEDSWISVAVKFKKGLAKKKLIQAITYLRANEYHGVHKGHHIFWYD